MPKVLLGIVGALALAVIGCGSDDDGDENLSLTVVAAAPPQVAANQIVDATVEVTSESGAPRAGVEVSFEVERGGGSLETAVLSGAAEPRVGSATVRSGDDGRATVSWRAGIAPVANRLSASAGAAEAVFDTEVVLAAPLQAEQFGDIPELLRDSGYVVEDDEGDETFLVSTEDLAFVSDDTLLLGLAVTAPTADVDGALVAMDPSGAAELLELGGDPLVGVLGIAIDRDGVLWAADPRGDAPGALLRIPESGVVETVITSTGEEDLLAPNYIAIGPDDRVYVSDPCLGIVLRYDPATGAVDDVLHTDVATQGGPNGLAFDASGEYLYFATESIALLCSRPDLPLTDPVAGLFRVPFGDAGFGTVEPIAERRGLFGDGLGFDVEGNLYVIFDTQANFMLEESAVWVMPAGETELVKFLATGDKVYANLAWGRGGFGDETLYIALLAVDAFQLPLRGVERIELGIAGLPLLP